MAVETMVREYKKGRDFNRDAQRLARNGWRVVSSTSRKKYRLLLWPVTRLVVTYTRP